jgi:hypothetical protein
MQKQGTAINSVDETNLSATSGGGQAQGRAKAASEGLAIPLQLGRREAVGARDQAIRLHHVSVSQLLEKSLNRRPVAGVGICTRPDA